MRSMQSHQMSVNSSGADHYLADAAQPLCVKGDPDGEGRGAPSERACLGRGPCGAAHHRSRFPVVADAEKRTVAAVVVVSQGHVVAVGIAAEIAQGLERGSAPTFAWFLATRGNGAISAQDLPMRIRDPLLIAWRSVCTARRPASRAKKACRRLLVGHCPASAVRFLYEYHRA